MEDTKVLLIEDTQSIREEIADILRFEGMQVMPAENGQEGIDLAKEFIPDLILCDIMMPIKDGYQVFNEIQVDPKLKNIPFIFLTAKATSENLRQGMILGADDYITKPFAIDTLIDSIKSRLKKERNRKKEEKQKRETLQFNISHAIPHELLTPLNGIIGFASLMADPEYDCSQKEMKEFSSSILESGNRLLKTIQKFIYYTEVELLISDKSRKKELTNSKTVMGNLVLSNRCKIIANKHNRLSDLELELEVFHCKVPLNHFEIIISNIVDNAFRFSAKGDKVKITVQTDENFVHIFVHDQGIGMSDFSKKDIEAFSHPNGLKIEYQGLGLGLITAVKLITFYEGIINWSENIPQGTSIQLSFKKAEL